MHCYFQVLYNIYIYRHTQVKYYMVERNMQIYVWLRTIPQDFSHSIACCHRTEVTSWVLLDGVGVDHGHLGVRGAAKAFRVFGCEEIGGIPVLVPKEYTPED